MSLLSHQSRISVKPFASVPPLADLPPIQRAQASVSSASSRSGIQAGIDLSEGCFVTKALKYTHQLGHWVSAVQNEDPEPIEELLEDALRVTRVDKFMLSHPSNLIFLTASLSTLEDLIDMVQSNNDSRQLTIDETGFFRFRSLNFNIPSFNKPEYELVALHPEHFLPCGSMLTVYNPSTATYKHYVVATDRRLRETPDPSSPCLPPFNHISEEDRYPINLPNVFFVILNAEIKFRRYFKMAQPPTPLPVDVINLMRRTTHLVDLLYSVPVPKEGSPGAMVVANKLAASQRQRNPIPSGSTRHSRLGWFTDVDFDTRRAYGTELMSDYDSTYHPVPFDEATPNDPHPYSEKTTVEAWQQGVGS